MPRSGGEESLHSERHREVGESIGGETPPLTGQSAPPIAQPNHKAAAASYHHQKLVNHKVYRYNIAMTAENHLPSNIGDLPDRSLGRKRNVTLKDVAAYAGVSKMTVSMILGGGPQSERFSPDTRLKVQNAASALKYHPSAVAQALTRRRMNTVGIVLSQQFTSLIDDPYICGLLDGAMAVNAGHGQNTTVFTAHVWHDSEQSVPLFCDGRTDGLILISPAIDSDVVQSLLEAEVPFVLVHNEDPDPRVASVSIDNKTAMKALVAHVIEHGHTRLAFLGGFPQSRSATDRYAGYCEAHALSRIPINPQLVSSLGYHYDVGVSETQRLMAMPRKAAPTALICGCDKTALGAAKVLTELGIRIPDDVSITGFDDIPDAALLVPGLTTVRLPMKQMGETAANLLLEQIERQEWTGRRELLLTEVVLRATVGPPPAT